MVISMAISFGVVKKKDLIGKLYKDIFSYFVLYLSKIKIKVQKQKKNKC